MSSGVVRRSRSDPELLWLWCRPAAVALTGPLAWEPPYAAGAAQEIATTTKDKKTKKKKKKKFYLSFLKWYNGLENILAVPQKIKHRITIGVYTQEN